MRVLSVVHGEEVRGEVFDDVVRGDGHELDEWWIVDRDEPPRPLGDYDAVLLFGGPQNVDQEDEHPWLRSEDDLGYLLRTLRNTFLNQKRTQSRRLRTAPLPDELDVIADPHATDPAAAVETGEVYAAVAALPADYRDVLVAVDVTGLSYKEAARVLRVREGTVMSRLYRARQQVVRRIEGETHDSG